MRYTKEFMFAAPLMALLFAGPTAAQHEGHGGQAGHQAPQKTPPRVGDAYPFDTCPISGKKLGAMGDPVVKVYDGREVRYCCGGCIKKFEKDLAKSFAAIDAKIVADQAPLYPLTTSVVTGEELPEKPVDVVVGNRLFRLGDAKEIARLRGAPGKYLAALDNAVVAAQAEHYPLRTCPVSGEELGGMGKPKDAVVAGRLIRVCCGDCLAEIEKSPAKFVAKLDAARKGAEPGKAGGHEHGKATEPGEAAKSGKGGCCGK